VSGHYLEASIHKLRTADIAKASFRFPAREMGKLILVGDLEAPAREVRGRTAVYGQVSSADEQAGLDRKIARMVAWATSTATESTRWHAKLTRHRTAIAASCSPC